MLTLIVVEIVLALAFSVAMMLYLSAHNSESGKLCKEAVKSLSNKKYIILFFVMLALSIGTWFYDKMAAQLPAEKAYVNSLVFILVIMMGYIDFKEHIIPNPLVLTGFGIWLIAATLEIFVGKTPWQKVMQFSLLGFFVCGGVLLILAAVFKSGLGMGDVKMFAMLGLIYGLSNTYSLLVFTVIPMAIVAIVLLATKKATKKSAMPMAPFTVLAFLFGILSGM